ncbi:MAG: DNA double-strand break repair nuclease NurA, partial [Methanomicrobiales archaeon]|nr:DNA double-strand break repair nuclease NurA [Methanomicrobiales archaeon]
MTPQEPFAEGLENAVTRIRDMLPDTLIGLFSDQSGISRESFQHIASPYTGKVAAVDGSHGILCDGGHFSIGIIRAAASVFQGGRRSRLRATPLQLVMIGPGRENTDFSEIYQESFHRPPHKPLINEDPLQTCGVLRETFEYAVAFLLAHELSAGDILIMDGALRVSHAALFPILQEIQEICGRRDVLLAAVTKKTSATWGKGHPLLPAVGGIAAQYGIGGRWYLNIPRDILDSTLSNEFYQGEIYVGKLSPDASRVFKVELPA